MKYNCKNYIKILYELSERETTPESRSGDEAIDREKLQKYTESIVAELLKQKGKKGAETLLKSESERISKLENEGGDFGDSIKVVIGTLYNWIYGGALFDVAENRKNITDETITQLLTSVKIDKSFLKEIKEKNPTVLEAKIDQTNTLTQDTIVRKEIWEKMNNFMLQHPIGEFTDEVYNIAVRDSKLEGLLTGGLRSKRKEVQELYVTIEKIKKQDTVNPMKKYLAVIDTVDYIIENNKKRYEQYTGLFQKDAGGVNTDLFQIWMRNALNSAQETGETQKVIYEKDNIKEGLTPEQEKIIKNAPPRDFYRAFVSVITVQYKDGKLSKESVAQYIDSVEKSLSIIIEARNIDKSIVDSYKDTINLMKSIGANDILYQSGIGSFFSKLFGDGANIEDFLQAAESGIGMKGGIGKGKDGKFKFYSVNQMVESIKRKGEEADKGIESAWKMYIKGLKGNYNDLESTFNKTILSGLAMYLESRDYESDIVSGLGNEEKESFKVFLSKYIGESPKAENIKILNENKDIIKTLDLRSYPKFSKLLTSHGLTISTISKDGRLPTPTEMAMEAFKGATDKGVPIRYEELKEAALADQDKIIQQLKDKDKNLSDSIPKDLLQWESIKKKFGIGELKDKEGRTISLIGNIDQINIVTVEERDIIVKSLEEKKAELEKNPNENKIDIEILEKIIEKIQTKGLIIKANVDQDGLKKTNESDVTQAIKTGSANAYSKAVTDTSKVEVIKLLVKENANHLSEQISDVTLATYGLTRADIVNSGTVYDFAKIRRAIDMLDKKLQKGEKLSEEENRLYATLKNIDYVVKEEVRVANEYQEFKQKHPYFSDTFASIEVSNPNIGNPKIVEQYQGAIRGSEAITSQEIVRFSELQAGTTYPASQIQELSSLGLSNETLTSTNISEISKGVYQIVTIDDAGRKYEINDVKKGELEKKMTDIDILGSMNAQILIPYMKMIQVFTPYNPQIRDIVAKDDKEKKRIQLISTIALLLGEALPGTGGQDKEKDIQNLQQKYTTSTSIFQKLSSRSRGVDQVFDDGGSIIMSNFERILRGLTPPIEKMTPEQILAKYGPQYIKTREGMSFSGSMEELRGGTISALNTLKSTITNTEDGKRKAQGKVLTGEYNA